MDLRKSIRVLVVAQVVLALLGVLFGVALEGTLPEPLRAWHDAEEARPVSTFEIVLLVAAGILAALYVTAWIHLWSLRRQARVLYTAACACSIAGTAALGPYAMTGIESALDVMGGMAGGSILGILYFSDLARTFGAPRARGPAPPEDDLIG